MTKFTQLKEIRLKGRSDINEKMIQEYIEADPSVLNLGDLSVRASEKIQSSGGRLDLLLEDDQDTRYELELQLGPTDESHIIRTIEYWDIERKRYPSKDHCAIIVAEDITNRFFNVISLFNGQIPLIALKLTAFEHSDGTISLTFTKVLDRITQEDADDDSYAPTDRDYWLKKSTPSIIGVVDEMFKTFLGGDLRFSMKYTKYYIGIAVDGAVNNFIKFHPKKKFVWLRIYNSERNESLESELDSKGIEFEYKASDRRYSIKISNKNIFEKCLIDIKPLVYESMKRSGLSMDSE